MQKCLSIFNTNVKFNANVITYTTILSKLTSYHRNISIVCSFRTNIFSLKCITPNRQNSSETVSRLYTFAHDE